MRSASISKPALTTLDEPELESPGWLLKLLTHPVTGLENLSGDGT